MSELQSAKSVVRAFYEALDKAQSVDELTKAHERFVTADYHWMGYHPFQDLTGTAEVSAKFWAPLKDALRAMQRRQDIFMAGKNELDGFQSTWVISMGHLMGLFDAPWLGIRPNRKIAMLRYCEFHQVVGDKITQTAMYFDIPHLMGQAGQFPFGPQTGIDLIQPGPATHEGLMFDAQDPAEGDRTLAAINFMINDIKTWKDGREMPLVEELRQSWHEDMIWWGPNGIGATYTIERYAEQHSGPFRAAFKERVFNGHVCRLAEGSFGGFFGRPNLTLTHAGGFMGMPATNTPADMRVIDLYRRRDDKLVENWIFIDLLHFWNMQGVDILKRFADIENPSL